MKLDSTFSHLHDVKQFGQNWKRKDLFCTHIIIFAYNKAQSFLPAFLTTAYWIGTEFWMVESLVVFLQSRNGFYRSKEQMTYFQRRQNCRND